MDTPSVKELAILVNQYVDLREQRLALDRESERIKELESEAKAKLIEGLAVSSAKSVGGKTHRVTLRTKNVPQVMDWEKVYAYIKANDAFELLQKRLSNPAVVERWDTGVAIDGVGSVEVTDLSINKL